MKTGSAHAVDGDVCDRHSYRPLFPFGTLKAIGRPVYRSQEARDYACLLDFDPEVTCWRSFTNQISVGSGHSRVGRHVDFEVVVGTERLLVEVVPTGEPRTGSDNGSCPAFSELLDRPGCRYVVVNHSDLDPIRLKNTRDLLRYVRFEASLGDRLRVLAALDEMGSLTLAECLTAVREGRAMDTIASLILRGHLEVSLDEKILDPDTIVRRSAN